MKSSFSPACFPVRVSHCLWVGCVREHKPVNVCHTGEMLSFGCAMTIILYSHTDASGVLLFSGWKLAIYRRKKKTTANYLLFKNWEETLCCVVMASTCFLLVSEWKPLQSSKTEFYYVSKWCTLWECLLCAVTCCRILCMESVQASKHVTGILLLRAM